MSGSDARWAELSSQNERVVQLTDPTADSAGPGGPARSRWAALASQRERLVGTADPEFQLASSGRASLSMRLVKGAA